MTNDRRQGKIISLAKALQENRELQKYLRTEEAAFSNKLTGILKEHEEVEFIGTDELKFIVRHEVSTNTTLTDNMTEARKVLLLRELMQVVTISITRVRDLFGEVVVDKLKVAQEKIHYCKFYRVN